MPRTRKKRTSRDGGDQRPAWRKQPGYAPRVVVKFRDGVSLPYNDQVADSLDKLRVGAWRQLTDEFPGITMRRMFTAASPDRIRELVESALRRDSTYRPTDFLSYFILDYPAETSVDRLLASIRAWKSVQDAYFDSPAAEPAVNANNDSRWPYQGYLDEAPSGISAEFAWGYTGGDGAGQDFIDLERGWTLTHEDLSAHGAVVLHGNVFDDARPHGTSVLGAVCAIDNAVGGVGIAPNLGSVNVVSYHGSTKPDAILAAIDKLPYGSVLLLEAQLLSVTIGGNTWSLVPIELLKGDFDVIRLATALGITVIEAAGNGGVDLDAIVGGGGLPVLARGDDRDSGAVMVGAASSIHPHSRVEDSNFGNRIDCYAWGEDVDTADSTSSAPFSINAYTGSFSGTSSAAAIIAGAALAVQGIAEANLGYRFSAFQMRGLLSNPATGTLSEDPPVDLVGVMPDLKQIINQNSIGIAPDVYVRDFVGDTGDIHTGAISSSPDIILRPAMEPNPQVAFGEGSGSENSNMLGSTAVAGQDNFIYVRVRNRGGSNAANVKAEVFWSPVATLSTPNLWTLIGSVVLPNVPPADTLTVSNAITWPAAAIPGSGHYCFVALIGNANDPPPAPADLLNWDNFQRLIRDNNNVTWRNFNVVDVEPVAGSNYVELDFMAPGAPDQARRMRLEVVARLPKGSRVALDIPQAMYDALPERFPAESARGKRVRLRMNPHGGRSLGEVLFSAKSNAKLRLLVQVPKEYRNMAYEVFVRQMDEDVEVGRVTWRLAPLREHRLMHPVNKVRVKRGARRRV